MSDVEHLFMCLETGVLVRVTFGGRAPRRKRLRGAGAGWGEGLSWVVVSAAGKFSLTSGGARGQELCYMAVPTLRPGGSL